MGYRPGLGGGLVARDAKNADVLVGYRPGLGGDIVARDAKSPDVLVAYRVRIHPCSALFSIANLL